MNICNSQIANHAQQLIKSDWKIQFQGTNRYVNIAKLGWVFKFNRRKRAFGLCSIKKKTIFLSKKLLDVNSDNFELWDDTIRHEIAHAIDYTLRNKSDHGRIWKSIAKQVGANPTRTSAGNLPKPKYHLTCPECDVSIPRERKSRKSYCKKCYDKDGSWIPLEYVQNY